MNHVQPFLVHDPSKLNEQDYVANPYDISPLRQGAFSCQSWIPYSEGRITSLPILVTLKKWETFIIHYISDNFDKSSAVIEAIRSNIDEVFIYPIFDLISIQTRNSLTKNEVAGDIGADGDGIQNSRFFYKFHLYTNNMSSLDIHDTLTKANSDVDAYLSPGSSVRHATFCMPNEIEFEFGNVYRWPASTAGIVFHKLVSCYDSHNITVSPICKWDFSNGAKTQLNALKNYSCSACPRNYYSIFGNFCVALNPQDTWENGFKKSFITGLETTLLKVLFNRNNATTNRIFEYLIDIIYNSSNDSKTWLPFRRIFSHGPLIDLSLYPDSLSNVSNDTITWLKGNPDPNHDCVAIDLQRRILFTKKCTDHIPFLTIINITSLLHENEGTNGILPFQENLPRYDSQCTKFGGIAPSISISEKICIINKPVNYTSWVEASALCDLYNATLPQPGEMFLNWEYENQLTATKSPFLFIRIGNNNNSIPPNDSRIQYSKWKMNTNLTYRFGSMDEHGWELNNETNGIILHKNLLCERRNPDYSFRRIVFKEDDGTLYVNPLNIENRIEDSLRCFRNGKIMESYRNDSGVILYDRSPGNVSCSLWRHNKFERIQSQSVLSRVPNSDHLFIAKLVNYDITYDPLKLDNTFFVSRRWDSVDKENLDICKRQMFNNIEGTQLGTVAMEHHYYDKKSHSVHQYIGIHINPRNDSETENNICRILQTLVANETNVTDGCVTDEIRSVVGCKEIERREMISNTALSWSSTTGAGIFFPNEDCIDADSNPLSLECVGDYFQGYYWNTPHTGNCTGRSTKRTRQLFAINNNMSAVSDLIHLINQPEDLLPVDITLLSSILDKSSSDNASSLLEFQSLVDIMNIIAAAKPTTLATVSTKYNTTNKLLDSFEKFALNCVKTNNSTSFNISQTIVAERIDLFEDKDVLGFFLSVSENEQSIGHVSNGSRNSPLDSVSAAIILPQDLRNLVSEMNGENKSKITLFVVHSNTKLFIDPLETKVRVNSPIIQISIKDTEIRNLKEPVKLFFKPEYPKNRSACAFWDLVEGRWSRDGCWIVNETEAHDALVRCYCDHFTSFALIVHIDADETHQFILSAISSIGCTLSIIALLLGMLIFLLSKDTRKLQSSKILFHLSVALFCSLVLFVHGIGRTKQKTVCLSISVALHYFILVSFNWMLVVGIHMYLKLVKILKYRKDIPKFVWKAGILAWGLPLIPIIFLLIYDIQLYNFNYKSLTHEICWISHVGFQYAFLPMTILVLVINSFIFLCIIITVKKQKNLTATASPTGYGVQQIMVTILLFFLLGLTWVFGLVGTYSQDLVFAYLFTICNSLQGLFIFVLQFRGNKKLQKQLNEIISTIFPSNEPNSLARSGSETLEIT